MRESVLSEEEDKREREDDNREQRSQKAQQGTNRGRRRCGAARGEGRRQGWRTRGVVEAGSGVGETIEGFLPPLLPSQQSLPCDNGSAPVVERPTTVRLPFLLTAPFGLRSEPMPSFHA